jgi:hypothetical protein
MSLNMLGHLKIIKTTGVNGMNIGDFFTIGKTTYKVVGFSLGDPLAKCKDVLYRVKS